MSSIIIGLQDKQTSYKSIITLLHSESNSYVALSPFGLPRYPHITSCHHLVTPPQTDDVNYEQPLYLTVI